MRVAGMDVDVIMNLINVTRGTYNSWFKNGDFAVVYHELPTLVQDFRQEAVKMLRKQNQLEAVLLEGKIIAKLKIELETGEYALAKTNLGREVYSKLMTDLDTPAPKAVSGTWMQRIDNLQQFFPKPQEQIEGGIVDAEFKEIGSEQEEHQESDHVSKGQPPNDET